MIKQELVSVVMPIYNAEDFVKLSVESVLQQTHRELELIVVDDFSSDRSLNIVSNISKVDKRVKIIKLSKNSGGPAHPRNIGISQASGKYVAFIDSDDVWKKDKIKLQIDFLKKNNCDFCSTDVANIDANGNKIRSNILVSIVKNYFFTRSFKTLLLSNFVNLSSVLLSKEMLGKEKFNEEKNLVASEDYYLWLTLYNKFENRCIFLDKKLVDYRIVEESLSFNFSKQNIRSLYCLTKYLLEHEESSRFKTLSILFLYLFLKTFMRK